MTIPMTDDIVERVARVLEPQAWAALGLCDTLAYKNRRTSSLRKARAAIEAMRDDTELCFAELYQIIGQLAHMAGIHDHPDVQRALDNAHAGRRVHKNLLPFNPTQNPHSAHRTQRSQIRS